MFTLSKGMYKEMIKKVEYSVTVVGLDGAGKTTFSEQFKACLDVSGDYKMRHPSKITSTVGLNLVKVDCGQVIINLWDVGGEAGLRSLWRTYLDECHAVIFIVDASDAGRADEVLKCIEEEVFTVDSIRSIPFVVLLNKCSMSGGAGGSGSGGRENGHCPEADAPASPSSYPIDGAKVLELQNRLRSILDERHEGEMAVMSVASREDSEMWRHGVQKSANWLLEALTRAPPR